MASGLVFFDMCSRCVMGGAAILVFSSPGHFWNKKLTTLSLPQWMVSGRAKVSKLIPTVRARRPHRRPPTPVRRPPPSAAPPSRGEQREHRGAVRPPPSPEPSVIHLTPDRPLLRLPTGMMWRCGNSDRAHSGREHDHAWNK